MHTPGPILLKSQLLSMAQGPMANQPSPAFPALTYQQAAQRIQLRASQGPHAISQLAIDVSSQLLRRGDKSWRVFAGCAVDGSCEPLGTLARSLQLARGHDAKCETKQPA